jgi:hypothetical protein
MTAPVQTCTIKSMSYEAFGQGPRPERARIGFYAMPDSDVLTGPVRPRPQLTMEGFPDAAF